MRALRALLVLVSLFAVAACKHRIPAPYARGQEPATNELLSATTPRITAIQVASAKVRANRGLRGSLAFIAQTPTRFRGGVYVAGNELVTLAFHEQGYSLRNKLDGIPQGFYAGPPAACAVQALLGVPFELDGLVALVLGGAPVIASPHEVLRQRWDKKAGHEVLEIANAINQQELRFAWHRGGWWFVGSTLWQRSGGKRGRRLWTVEHLELHSVGATLLPQKSRIARPGKRRDQFVVISYKQQDPDPEFARGQATSGGDDGDDGDDGGDDDGGWENEDDDGGWENEDGASADAGEPAPKPEPEPAPKPEPKPEPPTLVIPSPSRDAIPPAFSLTPAGLKDRGDLCK